MSVKCLCSVHVHRICYVHVLCTCTVHVPTCTCTYILYIHVCASTVVLYTIVVVVKYTLCICLSLPLLLISFPSTFPLPLSSLTECHSPNRNHVRRVDSHLSLWVLEARNLHPKKRYYCEISLNSVLYARTCCKMMNEILFWGEPFVFE